MDDEMTRLADPAAPPEMETIGSGFMQFLRDREPYPGSFLPKTIAERQKVLSQRSEDDLARLLHEIACNLAARDGLRSPDEVLTAAASRIRFRDWPRVKREIRRVSGL